MLNWVDEDALNLRRNMREFEKFLICTQKNTLSTTHAHTETHTHTQHACTILYICCFKSNGITVNICSLLLVKYKSVCPQITCKYRYDFPNYMFNVITLDLVFRFRTAIACSCFVTVRDRVILFKSALKNMFEECLVAYLAKTIVSFY